MKKEEQQKKRRAKEKERKNKSNGSYTALSDAIENSNRQREKERTGSNDYLARRQQATNAEEKDRERKQEARLGALKNTFIQTYTNMASSLSIASSFAVVSVLYHKQ